MGVLKTDSLVDKTWNCICGALNAQYNSKCGNCNIPKPKNKWDQKIKPTT